MVYKHNQELSVARKKRTAGNPLTEREELILAKADANRARHFARILAARQKRKSGETLSTNEENLLFSHDASSRRRDACLSAARKKRKAGNPLTEREESMLALADASNARKIARLSATRKKRREGEQLSEKEKKLLSSRDASEARVIARKAAALLEMDVAALQNTDENIEALFDASTLNSKMDELDVALPDDVLSGKCKAAIYTYICRSSTLETEMYLGLSTRLRRTDKGSEDDKVTVTMLREDPNWHFLPVESMVSSTNFKNIELLEKAHITRHFDNQNVKTLNQKRGGGSCGPNRNKILQLLPELHKQGKCLQFSVEDCQKGIYDINSNKTREMRINVAANLGQRYYCGVSYNTNWDDGKYALEK